MNEQGRQSAHDGCDPLSASPEWAAATRQRLPPPAFLKILSFEEAAYLLGCAPSVVCRLVMETGELAAVRFTTSGERLGAFSPDDIHGVMDRVGEDGSITATVPASGNLIDPGWRDIKAGILRIDRAELDRFITMNTPAVALSEPVAPIPMLSASPAPSEDLILELRRHREAVERAAHEAEQRHTHERVHAGFARIRAATEAGIKAVHATQKSNASPVPAVAVPEPVAAPAGAGKSEKSRRTSPTVHDSIVPFVARVMADHPEWSAKQIHSEMHRVAREGSHGLQMSRAGELVCSEAGRAFGLAAVEKATTACRKSGSSTVEPPSNP